MQYADIDHMDRRLDFTVDQVNFTGLEDYVREVKKEGLRFIIILDPAINAEVTYWLVLFKKDWYIPLPHLAEVISLIQHV